MRRTVDASAEYERALIRARTSSPLKAKVARGERLGGPRVGERLVDGCYEDNNPQVVLVQRVVALRRQGQPFRSIRDQLMAEGFRGRRGSALRLATLFSIARWHVLNLARASSSIVPAYWRVPDKSKFTVQSFMLFSTRAIVPLMALAFTFNVT